MGLARSNRLKHWKDFQTVFRAGKSYHSRDLTLRLHPVKNDQTPISTRIGLSISKKVSKLAVKRNRIKRQLRAILRQLLPHIDPNWKIVIIVRPTANQCNYEHFLQQLKQLLTTAEVFHGH